MKKVPVLTALLCLSLLLSAICAAAPSPANFIVASSLALSRPPLVERVVQVEAADLDRDGTNELLELRSTHYQGNPLAADHWTLLRNGEEIARLSHDDGSYGSASFKLPDANGDGQRDIWVYRISHGSGEALGLNIYTRSPGAWREIFSLPSQHSLTDESRYAVRYLGDYTIRFHDKTTGLQAAFPISRREPGGSKDIPEEFLQKIRTWIDPVSRYEIRDLDSDGLLEITAVQRVIGISHPHDIALLKTLYRLQNGHFRPVTQSLTGAEDKQVIRSVTLPPSHRLPTKKKP